MKMLKNCLSSLIICILLCMSVITANADSAPLNTATKVAFTVNCNKPHYEFTVYKVADLKKYSPSSDKKYQVIYESIINSISDSIVNGNSTTLLDALDNIENPTGAIGTYKVGTDGKSKTFSDLAQGIYYVRATNYPAGVKSVTNSVFALPYYTADEGWVYTIDPIPLATKVDDDDARIEKAITNSVKRNPNFTDVSIGDTVNFEIKTDVVGYYSASDPKTNFALSAYVITDKMSKGLTLNQNSFVVKLLSDNGTAVKTLSANTDYEVSVTASEGADTDFTVSITPTYLAKEEFYKAKKVSVTYSAILNEYAVVGKTGNPNEAVSLEYSNKNGVTAKVKGNTVYVYTYSLQILKTDESDNPLEGAEFAMYRTKREASEESANALAKGTSDKNGIVKFYNANNEEMHLQSGTYYILETKAPTGYNRYTDIITAKISAEYSNTIVNNSYVISEPENGISTYEVKNTKTVLPQTGGNGVTIFYVMAIMFAIMAVSVYAFNKKSKTVK